LKDGSVGIFSGILKTLDNSKADCHRLDADPIFTWFNSSEASSVSKVINLKRRKNEKK